MKKYTFFATFILLSCTPLCGMDGRASISGMTDSDKYYDITSLNKGAVLQALFQNAKSYDPNEQVTPQFSQESCRQKIAARADLYVGTVGSRAIGVHFDKNTIDVRSYNKNNGAGTAQKAIAGLRPQSKL